MMALNFSQSGLLIEILGFGIIAIPALFWNRKGIPFLPMRGEPRWWLYFIGVVLVFAGCASQFVGAS